MLWRVRETLSGMNRARDQDAAQKLCLHFKLIFRGKQ